MARRFRTLWKEFVEEYRRGRAPEELRERVETAIRVAARAGSWDEVLCADDPEGPGHGVPAPPRRHSRGTIPAPAFRERQR